MTAEGFAHAVNGFEAHVPGKLVVVLVHRGRTQPCKFCEMGLRPSPFAQECGQSNSNHYCSSSFTAIILHAVNARMGTVRIFLYAVCFLLECVKSGGARCGGRKQRKRGMPTLFSGLPSLYNGCDYLETIPVKDGS